MVLLRLSGGIEAGPELLSSHAAAGATVAWNTPGDWAALLRTTDFFGAPIFTMPALIVQFLSVTLGLTLDSAPMLLTDQTSYIATNEPNVGGRDTYCKLFESPGAVVKMRLYYGSGYFYLTYNAEWDQGSGKWWEDDDGVNAMAVGVSLYNSAPVMKVRTKLKVNFGAGWTTWDTELMHGGDLLPDVTGFEEYSSVAPFASGKYLDICKWIVTVSPGSSGNVAAYAAVTFHAVIPSIPNASVTDVIDSQGTWVIPPEVAPSSIDEYGLIIVGSGSDDAILTNWSYGNVYILD
jgi:hypothetical protein